MTHTNNTNTTICLYSYCSLIVCFSLSSKCKEVTVTPFASQLFHLNNKCVNSSENQITALQT